MSDALQLQARARPIFFSLWCMVSASASASASFFTSAPKLCQFVYFLKDPTIQRFGVVNSLVFYYETIVNAIVVSCLLLCRFFKFLLVCNSEGRLFLMIQFQQNQHLHSTILSCIHAKSQSKKALSSKQSMGFFTSYQTILETFWMAEHPANILFVSLLCSSACT